MIPLVAAVTAVLIATPEPSVEGVLLSALGGGLLLRGLWGMLRKP